MSVLPPYGNTVTICSSNILQIYQPCCIWNKMRQIRSYDKRTWSILMTLALQFAQPCIQKILRSLLWAENTRYNASLSARVSERIKWDVQKIFVVTRYELHFSSFVEALQFMSRHELSQFIVLYLLPLHFSLLCVCIAAFIVHIEHIAHI